MRRRQLERLRSRGNRSRRVACDPTKHRTRESCGEDGSPLALGPFGARTAGRAQEGFGPSAFGRTQVSSPRRARNPHASPAKLAAALALQPLDWRGSPGLRIGGTQAETPEQQPPAGLSSRTQRGWAQVTIKASTTLVVDRRGRPDLVGEALLAVTSSCLQGCSAATSRKALGPTKRRMDDRLETAGGPRAPRRDAVETPRMFRRACKCSRAARVAFGRRRRQGVKRFGGAFRMRARRARGTPGALVG